MLEGSLFLFSKPSLKSLVAFSKQQKCGKFLPCHTSPDDIYTGFNKPGLFQNGEYHFNPDKFTIFLEAELIVATLIIPGWVLKN